MLGLKKSRAKKHQTKIPEKKSEERDPKEQEVRLKDEEFVTTLLLVARSSFIYYLEHCYFTQLMEELKRGLLLAFFKARAVLLRAVF